MPTLFLLIGIATVYAEPYVGRPLYCDTDGTLLYSLGPTGPLPSKSRPSPSGRGAGGEVWVALDIRQFQTGQARCGDHVILLFPDGQALHAMALDAGPFAGYYVADYPDLPIVADMPSHLSPVDVGRIRPRLSSPVHLLNLSALDRAMDIYHAHIIPGE